MSHHFGGAGGGHYTAQVKHGGVGKWYNCDDSQVNLCQKERVDPVSAYALFYKLCDTTELCDTTGQYKNV